MKPSNDLMFARLRHPDLFNLDAAQGIRATSGVIAELEILLSGVKKLRKSYTMKHLRNPDAKMTASEHASVGQHEGMTRFSRALAGAFEPDTPAFVMPAPVAPAFVKQDEPVRDLPPDPEMDALIDKYLGD